MSRWACTLATLVGCFQATPVANTPCATSAECPSGLLCEGGRCGANAPADAAQTGDAPPTIDAPPAPGCPSFALQCDGFESDDLSAWTLELDPMATVAVTRDIAHTGTGALEASVPAMMVSGTRGFIARPGPVQSTGMIATRGWFFSPGPIDSFSGVMHVDADDRYALVSGDSNERWAVTEFSSAGLFDHGSATPAIAERWTCIELDYSFGPARVQLYVDDALVIDVAPSDPMPAYDEVGLGVTRAPLEGFRVFVDDVVIAHQHIGCE